MNKGDLVCMTTCNDRRIKGIVINSEPPMEGVFETMGIRYEVFIFESSVKRWFFERDLIKFE